MIVVTQLCGPTTGYFRRFGVCESADAAAAFSALVLLEFESTRLAAEAAFGLVCRVLRLTLTYLLARLPSDRRKTRLRVPPQAARPSTVACLTPPLGLRLRGVVVDERPDGRSEEVSHHEVTLRG